MVFIAACACSTWVRGTFRYKVKQATACLPSKRSVAAPPLVTSSDIYDYVL